MKLRGQVTSHLWLEALHKRSSESRREADRLERMINGGGNFCQLAYRAIIVISGSLGLGGQRGEEVVGE